MVDRPREDQDQEEIVDPITKIPLHEHVLNPIVQGQEIEPVESGGEEEIAASGPEENLELARSRRDRGGVQLYINVSPGDTREDIKRKAREAWRAARKSRGLDD